MQLAMVIGLVVLILIAAAITVAAQDKRAQHQEAERRRASLARLGEPVPHLTSPQATPRRHWPDR